MSWAVCGEPLGVGLGALTGLDWSACGLLGSVG